MRALLPLCAALALLAGCAPNSSEPVTASAPTVSYRVIGNDVAQATANAQQYCAQFGHEAQLQGIQPGASGNLAVFSCSGAGIAAAPAPAPAEGATAPPTVIAPAEPCADALHQDRPGGSDYTGPPVAGCPPAR